MVRGLTLLLLVACLPGCPGRSPGTGEGEGEGEGETFEGVTACVDDSDCDELSPCLDGACLPYYNHVCLDERFAVDFGHPYGRVDCSRWGATCIAGAGCVLPRGASCTSTVPCEATGGAQVCIDGQCPADDIDDHVGATPVLLPSTTTLSILPGDIDCLTATPTARGVLEVHHDGQVKLNQAGFRGAPLFGFGVAPNDAIAVDAEPFTICASGSAAETVTIELALTTTDVLDTVCIDDDHLKRSIVVDSCPAGTLCTHRAGAPGCRRPAGEACDIGGDDCVGVCERVDGVGTCSNARPDIVLDTAACRDDAFFILGRTNNDGMAIQAIDHCGAATCVPGRGCVVDGGGACFEEQFCSTGDEVVACTDGACL
jgi:hypothetical protein